MENEYDDFDDFDSTEESSGPDAIESTNSTVDAVAALLMGDEADEEGTGKDNAKTALYDSEGETRPKKNRTFNTIELDRHGNRVYDGQQREAAPETESPATFAQQAETLYQSEIDTAKQNTATEWDRITRQMNELQQDFNSGRLDEDSFNQQSFALGQQAGQIRDMAYRAELAGYQIKEQREATHAELTKILGDDVWGTPEARGATIQRVQEFVDEMGLDPAMLTDIEDASVVRTFVEAAQNHALVSEQKDEIAKLRGQVRRLKQSGKLKAEKAQKSMGVGARRDADHAVNEVAKLLMETGNARGGRK